MYENCDSFEPRNRTKYVYDATGQLAAEYGGTGDPVGTVYPVQDHLGSTRMVVNESGTVLALHDYLPFGEEIPSGVGGRTSSLYGAADGSLLRFTGKERDPETASSATRDGLDYFGARYFSAAQGRFTTVDPSMESVVLQNPQSWNRYSYTLNNPLRYIDPNGELWIASGDANNPYSWVDECQKKQTCYQSVAAVVGSSVRVYGSQNANDIANYAANKSGYVNLNDLAQHPDANFEVKTGAHSYLSLKNAAGFFNTAEQYGEQYPGDSPLFVTDAGLATGANFPPHKTHGQGRSVDIRYIDENGNSIQGNSAAANADVDRIRTLVDVAGENGFNQNYSARPKDFGTLFAPGHGSHLHIGTTKPVEQKIKPPNR